MTSRAVAAVAALFTLAFALPTAAQDLNQLCTAIGTLETGQWVQFNNTDNAAGISTMRFANIGTEQVDAQTYHWYEMSAESAEDDQSMVLQMLLSGGLTTMENVHGVVMKQGTQPAMRLPQQMIDMMRQQMAQQADVPFAQECLDAEVVGWEEITVAAGTFRALHMKHSKGDGWVSRDVPFGLIKAIDESGEVTELAGFGDGAQSSITEEPQEMPIPGMRRP